MLLLLTGITYQTTFFLVVIFFVCAALQDTLDQCTENLNEEFDQVFEWVKNQKTELMNQLNERFREREKLLDDEIASLEAHEAKAKKTKETCHETIQSMDINNPEREKKVINDCSECIKSNPDVYQVPIDLKFSWNDHDAVNRQLQRYGKLNYHNYKSGGKMEYTSCNVEVTPIKNKPNKPNKKKMNSPPARKPRAQAVMAEQKNDVLDPPPPQDEDEPESESDIGNNDLVNRLKEIPLPKLRRVNMRYKPNQDHELKFEPILRDPEFGSPNEEKEYEDAKAKYVFLHIQCMGNFDKKTKIAQRYWENGKKRFEIYTKLPRR